MKIRFYMQFRINLICMGLLARPRARHLCRSLAQAYELSQLWGGRHFCRKIVYEMSEIYVIFAGKIIKIPV